MIQAQFHKLTHSGIDVLEILKGSLDEISAGNCHWVIDKANESLREAARAFVTVLVKADVVCVEA